MERVPIVYMTDGLLSVDKIEQGRPLLTHLLLAVFDVLRRFGGRSNYANNSFDVYYW